MPYFYAAIATAIVGFVLAMLVFFNIMPKYGKYFMWGMFIMIAATAGLGGYYVWWTENHKMVTM